MKRLPISPPVIIAVGALALVGASIFLGVLPLQQTIQSKRTEIDSHRALIASLASQQRNIEVVSRNFARLNEQDQAVAAVFLSDKEVVNFFNELDALGDRLNVTNFEKRLDIPTTSGPQVIGLHLTFQTTYAGALELLQELQRFKQIVGPNNIVMTNSSGVQNLLVTLDALVAWEGTAG